MDPRYRGQHSADRDRHIRAWSDVDKFDRIFHLHIILSARRTPIPLEDLMARLECSKSTLHRAINALKDYLKRSHIGDSLLARAWGYTRRYGLSFLCGADVIVMILLK